MPDSDRLFELFGIQAAGQGHTSQKVILDFKASDFYKSFLKEIGVTPHHYLLNMRMEFARNRLIYTEDAIDAIAEEAGFSDRFHFSKVFKYVNAISPAAYRKLNRKEPGA